MTDGRRLHGYTISLACKPNGSGELIMQPFPSTKTKDNQSKNRESGMERK